MTSPEKSVNSELGQNISYCVFLVSLGVIFVLMRHSRLAWDVGRGSSDDFNLF